MKHYDKHLISLVWMHWWQLKKQHIQLMFLLVFVLAGCYGLYQGFTFKQKQVSTINAFKEEKWQAFVALKKGLAADTTSPDGRMAYEKAASTFSANRYLLLATYKIPVSTAILSIGQADIFPSYYGVKNEGFFMQLFKQSEIANPLRSLAGHFDTSFWIIYLLPLFIIVTGFNILPSERANGNWRIINSQGVAAQDWILSKCMLIGIIAGGMIVVIFLAGMAFNYLHFQQLPTFNDLLYFATGQCYIIFWLAIVYTINAFAINANQAALLGGIIWIAACCILPVLVTIVAEKTVPVDNTVVSRISRRPQGSKFEDSAFGKLTIHNLGIISPEYTGATLHPKSAAFVLGVYMAYHALLDDTNAIKVRDYYSQIERRQQITNASALINPAAAVDGLFAHLAANDAFAYHTFVWQTRAFQHTLHDAYFPPLFFDRPLNKADYDKISPFNYHPPALHFSTVISLLAVLFVANFLYILSANKLKKDNEI